MITFVIICMKGEINKRRVESKYGNNSNDLHCDYICDISA